MSAGDFAIVYNIKPLFDQGINGTGVAVAIVATSDVQLNDIATYRSSFGLSSTSVNVIETNPATDPGVSDPGENTEDLEMVSAAAPGATLDLVVSNATSTTSGFELSDEYIVDNETAPIMTVSYGICELFMGTALNTNVNKVFQQGATEGITIFVASGDSGAATCERQESTPPSADVYGDEVSGYASTPYATAVGGTDFNWSYNTGVSQSTYWNSTNTSDFVTAKGYIPEIPWNTTCASPSLLTVFTNPDGTPEFTNNEDLCNAANGNATFGNLVTFSAGGGGYSHCTVNSTPADITTMPDPTSCSGGYAKPSWQAGTGVPNDGKRDVPDIAMFGSYGFGGLKLGADINSTAILVCQSNAQQGISCDYTDPNQIPYQENGGTSAASPFAAGVMALVLQKTQAVQGLANPEFYKLASSQNTSACNTNTVAAGNSCYFHDITTGSNAQVCVTGAIDCVTNTNGDPLGIMDGFSGGAGYDRATGLGTMNVANVVNAWPTTSSTATLSFTPTSLTFPSTTVGATAPSQSITVKNTGTAAVTFSSIGTTGSTDFGVQSTNCPSPLPAGSTCTVTVGFVPAAAGTVTGAVSFADSATGSPQTVALSGTGASSGTTALTITPSSMTFPSTTVGSSAATQTITISNSTGAAVTFSPTTITGSGASSYTRSNVNCTSPLANGSTCTNVITFTPQSAGTLTAAVTYTTSASNSPQTVSLTGTGTSASTGLTITPGSMTFPSTTVGSSAATQTITLKNSTSASVTFTGGTTITGAGASSFSRANTNCTSPLPAGASCTNVITFTPQSTGTLSATVSYFDSASSSAQTVTLTGTGASANTGLTITPGSMTFPSTTVGTSAATQTITLKNNTSASVTFTASTTITGGGASSFSRANTNCASPLAAGASCTNVITFTPQSAGTLTATVNYFDSASSSAQTVALTGTGASASTGLTITPGSMTFASTTVGSSAATQVITLKNNTSSSITFTGTTTITGSGASSYSRMNTNCSSPLAPGVSCSNIITFTPQSVGTLTATVNYFDSASSSAQTVTLTGTGASASSGLTITPGSLTFASTAIGTSAPSQTITLKNNTSAAVTFTATTTITGTNANSFTRMNTNCASPLAAGASCTNVITFTPQNTGALAATVSYFDSASSSPQTVALYGTGH